MCNYFETEGGGVVEKRGQLTVRGAAQVRPATCVLAPAESTG